MILSSLLLTFWNSCKWRVDNDEALSADSFHTHEVIQPDKVYVKIDGSVPFIWPRLKNCWAVPEWVWRTESESETLLFRYANGTHQLDHKYYFIDHYCGREDELRYETLEILESGTGEDAHFSITPFEFNDYPGLGFELICTISLCYEPFFTCKLPGMFTFLDRYRHGKIFESESKTAKLIISRSFFSADQSWFVPANVIEWWDFLYCTQKLNKQRWLLLVT